MQKALTMSLRPRIALLLTLLCPTLVGCTKKPTQDQCNALPDHMAKLLSQAKIKNAEGANKLKDKERDRFVMVCVREGSYEVVECMLKADSWNQLIADCASMVRG